MKKNIKHHDNCPVELMELASHAVSEKWGMGALHLGIAVLDAVPDGWLKISGTWIKLDSDDLFCLGLGE